MDQKRNLFLGILLTWSFCFSAKGGVLLGPEPEENVDRNKVTKVWLPKIFLRTENLTCLESGINKDQVLISGVFTSKGRNVTSAIQKVTVKRAIVKSGKTQSIQGVFVFAGLECFGKSLSLASVPSPGCIGNQLLNIDTLLKMATPKYRRFPNADFQVGNGDDSLGKTGTAARQNLPYINFEVKFNPKNSRVAKHRAADLALSNSVDRGIWRNAPYFRDLEYLYSVFGDYLANVSSCCIEVAEAKRQKCFTKFSD
jgi:hypothetical protein